MQKVSVIIPCYNQGEYIYEALDSVVAQTYTNIEIIIVNDGSTDKRTIEILSGINEKYSANIKIINTKNQGLAMARNNGIKESLGEYILPLDADDKIVNTYIEKAIKILNENSDIGVVYSFAKYFGCKSRIFALKDFNKTTMLTENLVFCSAVYRRKDYDRTVGYNPNMIYGYEDWDFWVSMIEKNVNFYRINEIMFYYRIKKESMITKLADGKGLDKESLMYSQVIKNHAALYNENIEAILIENRKNSNRGKLNQIFNKINLLIRINKFKKLIKQSNNK